MVSSRKLRVGKVPGAAGSGANGFFTLKDGDTATLTILAEIDEIVSVDQFALWDINPAPVWVDCGPDDPGRELGLDTGYRAFVPVAVSVDGNEEVKLWSIGIGIHRDLAEIAAMSEGLKGLVVRAKRAGSGMKTRYTIVSTGKRSTKMPSKIPTSDDICATLGPETREDIITMIEERAGMSFAKVKATYGKAAKGGDDDEVEELF